MDCHGISVENLVYRFECILDERMRDLPFVNPNMQVEAVGFREYDNRPLGVLITPWFMNLVMLPADDDWNESAQGSVVAIDFPSGSVEFTVCADEVMGTYLSAILFRSVTDIPDQQTARELAVEVMKELFTKARDKNTVSRRALFTGLKAS
jgi:[NiFe] hydrogenase assembly HybE family chaperone